MRFLLVLFVFAVRRSAQGLNVAVFVWDQFASQTVWSARVADVLAHGGHTVTLIRVQSLGDYGSKSPKAHRSVKSIVVDTSLGTEFVADLKAGHDRIVFGSMTALDYAFEGRKQLGFFVNMTAHACEGLLKNEPFMREFAESKYDIVFAHAYNYCPIGLTRVANVPTWVWLVGGPMLEYVGQEVGLPTVPSCVPTHSADTNGRMSFMQRLKGLLAHVFVPIAHVNVVSSSEDEVFHKHEHRPAQSLRQLGRDAPLVMVNSNELYDFPRPGLRRVVNIGGLGMRKTVAKSLEEPFLSVVGNADKAVIFSLGSLANASSMPWAWKEAFMKAFASLPDVTFILRYGGNDLDAIKPSNVITSGWIPQTDLLHHQNVRAMITHGGYNSIQEVISAGKPIVCIPLFGDQYRNCKLAEKHGIARIVDKTYINEDSVRHAVEALLRTQSHYLAARKMQRMLEKEGDDAEERLLRWTEFLAEKKTLPMLVPQSSRLSVFSLYSADSLISGTAIAFIAVYVMSV